ncbi:MAG: M23 family metallopeptidase [Candidatus Sumerlaeota bacterium]|nr:M23 family metallopeptidase [Candidatus Sumerlaeota bacterium]
MKKIIKYSLFLCACVAFSSPAGMISIHAVSPPRLKGSYDYSRGWYHRVKSGDTLYKIARTYDTLPQTLAKANGLDIDATLKPGAYIFIPPSSSGVVPQTTPSPGTRSSSTRKVAHRDYGKQKSGNSQLTPPLPPLRYVRNEVEKQNDKTARTAGDEARPDPPDSSHAASADSSKTRLDSSSYTARPTNRPSSKGFIWPLRGKILKDYSGAKDSPHKGLDISAPKGTLIKAAKDGKVIYSGDGIPGYGNLVILEHKDGLSTVYAHNSENLVRVGEWVSQGSVIAKVGSTGRATTNHLHFEMRRNALPVNPRLYLP